MNIGQRLHDSWHRIQDSLLVIWDHKQLLTYKLMLYALKAFLLGIPYFMLRFYFGPDFEYGLASTHPILFALLSGTLLFVTLLVKYYLDVALAHHTLHILHTQEPGSITQSLRAPHKTLNPLFAFAASWFALDFPAHFISYYSIPLFFIATALVIFITFYFIPALASTQLSFFQALRLSFHLSKTTIVEIAFGTILLLSSAKLLGMGAFLLTNSPSLGSVRYILALLAWLLEAAIATLFIIFRTVMFFEYYKRPLEELDALRNPEF